MSMDPVDTTQDGDFKPAHARPGRAQDPASKAIESQVIEALRSTYDPEIPVNIYELGLVYDIDVQPDGRVAVQMTLTSPMCPVAGTLPGDVEARIRAIPGVSDARVDVTWDPPWGPDKMTEAAKIQLNMI
ncbi:MAG TPA: SUF system Fe-S cluster assembly protein [Candidatus Polarisedimenticolia bacterium]|nr:SUF system Fe-S cluster assembly protein [Candidatus Polarisedimenticolia bacterium]